MVFAATIRTFGGLFIVIMPLIHTPDRGQYQRQGIEGHVWRISGNQMPSPDRKPPAPAGIKTTLYIFELTNISQVRKQGQSGFYSAIKTNLVKKTKTDSKGYFKTELPPGHYSLFIKKDLLFYANWFDGHDNIAPVQVNPGKLTRVDFKIDYDAYY